VSFSLVHTCVVFTRSHFSVYIWKRISASMFSIICHAIENAVSGIACAASFSVGFSAGSKHLSLIGRAFSRDRKAINASHAPKATETLATQAIRSLCFYMWTQCSLSWFERLRFHHCIPSFWCGWLPKTHQNVCVSASALVWTGPCLDNAASLSHLPSNRVLGWPALGLPYLYLPLHNVPSSMAGLYHVTKSYIGA